MTDSHRPQAARLALALYVPSNVPRFIDGAHKRGADAIILDLEDSVPIAERPAARRDLIATLRERRARRRRRDRAHQPAVAPDACSTSKPRSGRGCNALAVTKVDSADHVKLIAEVVSELEAERGMALGTTQFMRDGRDAAALFRMPEIAQREPAHRRR